MELTSNFLSTSSIYFSYCSLFTKVCYGTRHYLSWHSACLYFLKVVLFLFSYSTAANYSSCSLFYFNPQSSLFSLGFAFTHGHNMGCFFFFFFPFLCLILFHIQPGEERPLTENEKALELIFICVAVPMAFLECADVCYHQVLIMQLK